MSYIPCVIHNQPHGWEINPKTGVETQRCPRCGQILQTRQGKKDEEL